MTPVTLRPAAINIVPRFTAQTNRSEKTDVTSRLFSLAITRLPASLDGERASCRLPSVHRWTETVKGRQRKCYSVAVATLEVIASIRLPMKAGGHYTDGDEPHDHEDN